MGMSITGVNKGDSIHYKDFSWHNDGYLPQSVRDTLFKIRLLFKNEAIGYFSVNEFFWISIYKI
jgi:hypothetical protein